MALARGWAVLLSPLLPTAPAVNLLSAVATAAACGALGAVVGRSLRDAASGFAAALGAGLLATVWRNATETEVYAAALLLGALALLAAERAGRAGDRRALVAAGYLLALAVPLHLFALVATPGAMVLAAVPPAGRVRAAPAVALAGTATLAMGVASLSAAVGLAGLLVLAAAAWLDARAGEARRGTATSAALLAAVAVAATALVIMRVRAGFEPALAQGDPRTWSALADVVARRQYELAGLWPRQAPLWLQLANVLEWADWQVALGVDCGVAPSVLRTPFTVAWVVLGVAGAATYRRRDRRGWLALLALLVGGSVGVALQLNLKAGPTFGWGILPDDAPHEARERDYFFVFAFWVWGAWAAVGAVALARRLSGRAWPGAALAALPLLLNWGAADRRRGPDADLARAVGEALLLATPPHGVLLTAGDNDTYPTWYLQQVEGVRPDVVAIPVGLLPAPWFRAELRRRWGVEAGARWTGEEDALRRLAASARALGRPVAVSVGLPVDVRGGIAPRWIERGAVWRLDHEGAGETADDRRARAAVARHAASFAGEPPARGAHVDGGVRQVRRVLACAAAAEARAGRPGWLDSACNAR